MSKEKYAITKFTNYVVFETDKIRYWQNDQINHQTSNSGFKKILRAITKRKFVDEKF